MIARKDVIGGTCINTGTLPSKTMREAVLHLSGFQYQGIYGINYHASFGDPHVLKVESANIVADLGDARAYMLYLGDTKYVSNAILINYHPHTKRSAVDDALWARFIAGIKRLGGRLGHPADRGATRRRSASEKCE